MSEWPTPREMLAWAEETVVHSRAIRADSVRVRASARATRAESRRLRRHARLRRTAGVDRRNV